MSPRYVPEAGDIVWLQFDPQAGQCRALVVSPSAYNGKTGLMVCCPMTSQIKGYPFEVVIEGDSTVAGAALADQMKSLDWAARKARYKGNISVAELAQVRAKMTALTGKA